MNTHNTQQQQKTQGMKMPTPDTNPFRVPEGYFQSLPYHVMNRIAAQQPPVQRKRIKLAAWCISMSVAAAFIGFIFVLGINNNSIVGGGATSTDVSNFAQVMDVEFGDEAIEYAMLNNTDIEYYLTIAE